MIDPDALGLELSDDVRGRFLRWRGFLYDHVDFLLRDSVLHTYGHCERVLLLGLLIGEREGLSADEREAVAMAAVFHDSRRVDEWLDVGHGRRGADNYRDRCGRTGLRFDARSYLAMAYHDRRDGESEEAIRGEAEDPESAVRVYRVLKDADGLDRFRLGPCAMDPSYLRTESARNMVDFARDLAARTA